jgi:hypothetical protein
MKDVYAMVTIFDDVIKEATQKYDHQSLSSLEVICFISERFEELTNEFLS